MPYTALFILYQIITMPYLAFLEFFERSVCYIKNAIEVLSVKVFVFVNLRSYLTDDQMQELI